MSENKLTTSNVVDLEAYRLQRKIEAALEDSIAQAKPASWQIVEGVQPDITALRGGWYLATHPREVNNLIAHLFQREPCEGLSVTVEPRLGRYRVRTRGTVCQQGDTVFPQEVFETAMRLMDEGRTYELIATDLGFWSAEPFHDYEELLPVLFADPDFGRGAREKSDAEIEELRMQEEGDYAVTLDPTWLDQDH